MFPPPRCKSRSQYPAGVWHLRQVLSRLFIATRNIAAFLAGVTLAATALSAWVPFPKISSLWRKYHHLQENGDKYSLIYIGSSRVFHEFIPEQFDAALEARKHAVNSMNFGQDGMWPPESLYMVRQILATKPKTLKWVMLDLMQIKPLLGGNETSQRSVYWHDARHTWISLNHIASVDMDGQRTFSEKFETAIVHLRLWIQRSTNAGSGSDRLQIALKLDKEKKPEALKRDGWDPGKSGPLQGSELERFTQGVARLKASQPKPMPPLLREALDDIIAEIRAAGAEPIFVAPSGLYAREVYTDWPPAGVQVFNFDDPDKYPQLYNPQHRCDADHLDPTGAADFTRLLAERFAQYLEEKK